MPTSFDHLVPAQRRQAAQVLLDQRPHGREVEAADEDEEEVARIRKAVLVERQRPGEVHPIDAGRRQRLRAQMVLAQGGVERLVEQLVRLRLPIGQRHLQLLGQHLERDRIGARRGEGEVDQLEHRLEILARGAARQPFLGRPDVSSHRRRRPGENLLQIEPAEATETALRNDRIRGFRRNEILIARERRAPGADGAKHDLVLLERRRLQHDADAVGERPFGDAQRVGARDVLATAPAVGRRASKGLLLAVSTYAVSRSAFVSC